MTSSIVNKKIIPIVLAIAMIFAYMPISMVSAATGDTLETETPALAVTGSEVIPGGYTAANVGYEKSYTLDELKAMDKGSSYTYSSLNSSGTKKTYLGKGVEISELLSLSGVTNLNGKSLATIASDGYKSTPIPDIGTPRYYYPNYNSENSSVVPSILSWENGNSSEPSDAPAPPTSMKSSDLLVLAGQKDVTDQNNPYFTKKTNVIQLGNKIADKVLTVDDEEYTRSELLLKARATHAYGESNEITARGIPAANLVKDARNNDIFVFTNVDGDVTKVKKSALLSGNYILAYEEGENASSLNGIYDTDEEGKKGFLTLYGDGAVPVDFISSVEIEGKIDFSNSPFKHITNGGKGTDGETNLYNLDAITSATVTVEGPAVEKSIPLSIKELESNNDSLYRGTYAFEDESGNKKEFTYEGVDLAYLLTQMESGTNGIKRTSDAKKVQIKDINRNTIATLNIEDILKESDRGKPVILSYGISNGEKTAPFVFTSAITDRHEKGYEAALDNEDGCMKLVYDLESIESTHEPAYTKFTNAAYIYVMAEDEPGYAHDKEPYNDPDITNYTYTFEGEELGREINLTTGGIEKLYETKPDMAETKEYSLANNNYWYVNEYKGIKLWDLLNYIGIPEASGTDDNKSKKVTFTATDGYASADSFTLEELANPSLFHYYEKNADDKNDGNYVEKPGDLKYSGYPVLLASGVNRYPYVIDSKDTGFKSGLGNDGGPMRVIFGKRNYKHANGSSQIQKVKNIKVGGGDYHYSTHKYSDTTTALGTTYSALAENKINITVKDEDGTQIKNKEYSIGDIEDLIYKAGLGRAAKDSAQSKGFFETAGTNPYSDLYEGVNLEYLIWENLEIPGIKGDITFRNDTPGEEDDVTVKLEDMLKTGYNTTTKQSGLKPTLAFAKNGSPLVEGKSPAEGYVSKYQISGGISMDIKNTGGPLMLLIPSDDPINTDNTESLKNVTGIEINLKADKYAHVESPYSDLKGNKITIKGEGTYLEEEKEFTVEEIESKQTLAATGDYNIKTDSGQSQLRYRGISLYDFLKSTSVGLRINADKVKVKSSTGDTVELPLSDIIKSDYINGQDTTITNLKTLIAYGSAPVIETDKDKGKPLVNDESSDGYDSDYKNAGGPLKLVTGQKNLDDKNSERILDDIVEIEITASELDSWKHSVNDIYKKYLDYELELVIKNSDNTGTKKIKLKDLENMDSIITRDTYTVPKVEAEIEGIDVWKLVKKIAGNIEGIDDPISVKGISTDGSTADILQVASNMDQVKNGIIDSAGNRKAIILAYAINGFPLVPNKTDDGYTGTGGGNDYGPLRLITENTGGSCLKYFKTLEVTIPGSGEIIIPEEEEETPFEQFPADGETGNLPNGASVRCVTANANGDIWVGTYNAGAHFKAADSDGFTINTMKTNGYKLSSSSVTGIAEDKDGGVWFTQSGSYTEPDRNKGVAYIKDGMTTYYNTDTPNTIPHNYVQDVKIDSKGNVWFASFGGLTKYNPTAKTWKTWTTADGLPALSVNKIIIDENDGVWVGCYPDEKIKGVYTGGFCYLDNNGNIEYSYEAQSDANDGSNLLLADSWVRDIALDGDGGAWIVRSGSYGNLANVGGRIDHVDYKGNITHYTGAELLGSKIRYNSEVRALDVDQGGNLWLGTWDGVYVFDSDLSLIKEYSKAAGSWDSANMDNIYSLNIYNNTVYIGSDAGVVYKEGFADKKADPALTVVNEGKTAAKFSDDELDDLSTGPYNYSALKAQEPFSYYPGVPGANGAKYTGFKGATIESILDESGIDISTLRDTTKIKFVSKGKNKEELTMTWKQLSETRYAFGESPSKPRIGVVPAILVSPKDSEEAMRLFVGQLDVNEANAPYFHKDVCKIIISDSVTVTLDGNGGTAPKTSFEATLREPYGAIADATRAGYTFNGWFTAPEGGDKINETTKVTNRDNHTLYAQWTANSVKVKLDANKGKLPKKTHTVNINGMELRLPAEITSYTVNCGSTYGTFAKATRSNYSFNGWYTKKSGGTKIKSTTTVTNSKDHTVYAQWTGTSKNLKSLKASKGKFSKKFKATTASYTLKLKKSQSKTKITATKAQSVAKVKIKVGKGKWKTVKSATVKVKKGKSVTVKIKVTAQNKKAKTYTVKVKRAK